MRINYLTASKYVAPAMMGCSVWRRGEFRWEKVWRVRVQARGLTIYTAAAVAKGHWRMKGPGGLKGDKGNTPSLNQATINSY